MSIIPNTYNGLVSAIKSVAEDDSVEFAAYIPVAIHLAEKRLTKEIDTEGLHLNTTIVATSGNNSISKPNGYRLGYDLSYTTSTGRKFVTKKTDDFIKDYWPVETSVGQPKYYADKNNTTFILAPTPSSSYSFDLSYLGEVSSLSTSIQSNYFTEFVSDGLFYATMSNMTEFMKDYESQVVWENKYNFAMQSTNNEGRRQRREDGMAPNNINKERNTLQGDN